MNNPQKPTVLNLIDRTQLVFDTVQFPKFIGPISTALDAHWGSNVLHTADKHEALPDWIYDAAAYYLHQSIESESGYNEELTLEEVVEDLTEFHNRPVVGADELAATTINLAQRLAVDRLFDWMVKNYRANSAVDRNLGHYMTIPLKLLVEALGITNTEFEEAEWDYHKESKMEMKE